MKTHEALEALDELDDHIFAFGGDDTDPPRVQDVPGRKSREIDPDPDPDDDDDDDEYIPDAKDRKLKKLSRESNRKRIQNKQLRDALAEKESEIADLRKELGNAVKLQKKYDTLVSEQTDQRDAIRRLAIRQAIEKDTQSEGVSRSWYDVNMVESLLDVNELAIDTSDFSVGGLKEQLDAIAEDKPFLVKSSESSGQGEQKAPPRSSGSAPQSSATGTPEQNRSTEEDQWGVDFPALNTVV